MTDFMDSLEAKAEKIILGFDPRDWDNSIPAVVKREIALTLDQIRRLRDFHKNQLSNLSYSECQIGTELIQMQDRLPKYSSLKYPENEKFQRQLLGLKTDRRRQELFFEDKLQNLQRTLLGLIHKYEQVHTFDDKSRQNSAKTRTHRSRRG